MNPDWLLLIPVLGLTEASCCLFGRIWEVVKHEPRPAIHMEKKLQLACKLGGVNSKAGQTVLARLMESQIWHQHAGYLRGWFRKGTMASAHLDARHFSSFIYASGAFQTATQVLELRGNESE